MTITKAVEWVTVRKYEDILYEKYNGIAIDLGSVVDTWANEFHSRKFLRNEEWKNQ